MLELLKDVEEGVYYFLHAIYGKHTIYVPRLFYQYLIINIFPERSRGRERERERTFQL